MKQQVAFHCYGLRPKHVDLDPFPHAIYLTLKNARGIFAKGGFSVAAIRSSLVRENAALAKAITETHILAELRKLKGLGLAEQLASAPDRWRVAR